MAETGVLCPSCGSDVGQGNPAYCPSCRTPLLGQRQAEADRSVADPFGDWPDATPAPYGTTRESGPASQAFEQATTIEAPPPAPPRQSRRWVRVLIIIGVIFFIRVGWAVVSGVFAGPERDDQGAVVEAGTVSAFDIRVGDCFSLPDDSVISIEAAELVPCSEPHTYEAYADYVYPEKAQEPYPGLQPILDQSDAFCLDEFEAFVDHRWETSVLDFAYLYPEEEGWQFGDRTVLCLIQPTSNTPLIGTMRGAGI